jgi:polar amino acid transport system substrate-binding protein
MQIRAALIVLGSLVIATAYAQEQLVPSQAVLNDLAPTGSLRFAYPKENAPMSIVGQALGRMLAEQLNVPYEAYPIEGPQQFMRTLGKNEWDIMMLSYFPRPGTEGLIYTVPVLETDHAFLVRAGLGLNTLEDIDKPGIRIAVRSETIYDYRLRDIIKQAEIQRYSEQSGQPRLEAEEAEVLATTRTGALRIGKELPGSHVIVERFGITPVVFALSDNRTTGRDYAERFIQEQLSAGVVAKLIEQSNLGEGTNPATP